MRSSEALRLSILVALLVCQCRGLSVGGLVKRVTEGSQVTLQCRIPAGRVLRVMDTSDTSSTSLMNVMPIIWVRFDMEDPNNHEVISHGNTLFIDNPRLSVDFDEETGKSVLTIDSVEQQDGGSYQCQVPMETEAEVISSTPVEVIVEPPSLIATSRPPVENAATTIPLKGSWMVAPLMACLYIRHYYSHF